MELLTVLIMLSVLFVLASLGSLIFEKLGIPGLIGQIVVGIIVANIVWDGGSFLGFFDVVMPAEGVSASLNYNALAIISEMGAIFLLFCVGLETRSCEIMSVGKPAMYVAILGVILPFAAGISLYFYDRNIVHAMYMAAAMVATSVGVTAKVIMDLKASNTKEARIIIGAAVIDDILGMIVLAIVSGMTSNEGLSILSVLKVVFISVLFVMAVFVFCQRCVPWLASRSKKRCDAGKDSGRKIDKAVFAIAVCLIMSTISQALGLAAIIGAFLGGMMLADYAEKWNLKVTIGTITSFFLPFFFLHVGMQVHVSSLTSATVLALAAVVIFLAVIMKYVGCYIGVRISDKTADKKSANIVGIGMIPRAEVGIIIAAIGLSTGHLTSDMNAVIVLMSVVTTIIAPPLIERAFKKKYPEGIPETPAISCWEAP